MAEHAEHVPAAHAAHRVQYLATFIVLGALTLVELGVARTPGIARSAVVVALALIAIAKAALIALFYMHLRYETRVLRATVFAPLLAPGLYGIVLIAEAGWRHSW